MVLAFPCLYPKGGGIADRGKPEPNALGVPCEKFGVVLAIEKIVDWKKLEILVQSSHFQILSLNYLLHAPHNSGRDNAAGIIIV